MDCRSEFSLPPHRATIPCCCDLLATSNGSKCKTQLLHFFNVCSLCSSAGLTRLAARKGVPSPMSRSRIRILLFFAILIPGAALAQVSPGATQYNPQQRQRPALTGTITVTGVVVNAVTGEPISRALIQLQGMVQRTALTDSDGRFQFDNLPETQAMLM